MERGWPPRTCVCVLGNHTKPRTRPATPSPLCIQTSWLFPVCGNCPWGHLSTAPVQATSPRRRWHLITGPVSPCATEVPSLSGSHTQSGPGRSPFWCPCYLLGPQVDPRVGTLPRQPASFPLTFSSLFPLLCLLSCPPHAPFLCFSFCPSTGHLSRQRN